MKKFTGLDNIFTRTDVVSPTPRPTQVPIKPPSVAKVERSDKEASTTRIGRPVSLDAARKATIILEKKHIEDMDVALMELKRRTGTRGSYSEIIRWLIDNHLPDFMRSK